jgi:hypothetical protein
MPHDAFSEGGVVMRAARSVAAVLALVALGGLALQFAIFAGLVGVGLASWRFVGFFTVLSNIGIVVISTAIALGLDNRLTSSRSRLMGLTAIVTVGLVYSVMLRSLWNPTGLQKLADAALHDWTPLLFAVLWTLMPHGKLVWRDLKWALMPPAIYLAYAMTRGAFDGWYPYYFLNPARQTAAELALSIMSTLVVFSAVAACAIAMDMRLGNRRA